MSELHPLFEFVATELHPTTHLDGVLLIACQHLLKTTIPMFEVFFRKGLKPENCFVLGKSYSTHHETLGEFRSRGMQVSDLSQAFDSHQSFDEQFTGYVKTFLEEVQRQMAGKNFQRILLLDDGGYLIEQAQHMFPADVLRGVEQTSSGYTRLVSLPLRIPVVNVARSWAKLERESPLIARVAVNEIERWIEEYKLSCPSIAVVGKGPIGSEIQHLLQERYSVHGCDILSDRCDFGGNFKQELNKFQVIIGATGGAAFDMSEILSMRHQTLLMSASSSDREFPSAELRRMVPKTHDPHRTEKIGNVVLVNSGFPVNFTGGPYSLPPGESAFTRSLLVSAVCQAVDQKEAAGFCAMDEDDQKRIVSFLSR